MDANATKPTFLWRGILILLPVILLAGVGLYMMQEDRLMVEFEARQLCQDRAQGCAMNISNKVLALMERRARGQILSERMVLDAEGNLFSIDSSRPRATIPRDPVPQPFPETELSPAQSNAWHEASRTEYAATETSNAVPAWRKFLELFPPEPFLTQARYDLGLMLVKDKENAAAAELFREVETNPDATTESGLPLALLAELQLTQIRHSGPFHLFYQILLDQPSFATPAILAQLDSLQTPTSPLDQVWLDKWAADEAARDFYLHIRPELISGTRPFWTKWDGQGWLVMRRFSPGGDSELLPFTESVVAQSVREAVKFGNALPDYVALGVEIEGNAVLPVNPQWPVLGSFEISHYQGDTNTRPVPAGTVTLFLGQPGLLYARQQARSKWICLLIIASAAAAMAGLIGAYRGFHQQLRLSELKSNFVSSVSHELRAPIASMRLLAESLQRGKVPDTEKQNEYYGFLVQESRRLSSLIENILDFSRIEQGRKKYHFEPTDLDFLVEQTVKLMQPCAAERGVALKLEKADDTGPAVVNCDGLAVQQALLNLIDNAVKHSGNGAEVMIGLERGPDDFRLWVEDSGPGIPADEHGRIFERFYRRGSELRRETQGIGIGLSIVKHSVEAHGGRVVVRSAAGEGSRFTMILPNLPPTEEHEHGD